MSTTEAVTTAEAAAAPAPAPATATVEDLYDPAELAVPAAEPAHAALAAQGNAVEPQINYASAEVAADPRTKPPPPVPQGPHSHVRKLFIGGISWDTTDEGFRRFFERFGEVEESLVMRDKSTGASRGFGFVTFAKPEVAHQVLTENLDLDGRRVDPKLAIPREEMPRETNNAPKKIAARKLFIGGVSPKITQEAFHKYFEQFGTLIEAVIMTDPHTGESRGFGFVRYDEQEPIETILSRDDHFISNIKVDCRRAVPRGNERERDRDRGRGGGGGFRRGGRDRGGFERGGYYDDYYGHGGRDERGPAYSGNYGGGYQGDYYGDAYDSRGGASAPPAAAVGSYDGYYDYNAQYDQGAAAYGRVAYEQAADYGRGDYGRPEYGRGAGGGGGAYGRAADYGAREAYDRGYGRPEYDRGGAEYGRGSYDYGARAEYRDQQWATYDQGGVAVASGDVRPPAAGPDVAEQMYGYGDRGAPAAAAAAAASYGPEHGYGGSYSGAPDPNAYGYGREVSPGRGGGYAAYGRSGRGGSSGDRAYHPYRQ